MKEKIIKKPNIYDYLSTDERTFVKLDGKVNWEKYAKALDEFIQILAECKCDHSNDKLDKIDKRGGWICPRCQKVHSWLSMTCDCPPNVITASTIESKEVTEIKGEKNCNNCIWGKCLTAGWPCFDCDGSNKWEPIKTE